MKNKIFILALLSTAVISILGGCAGEATNAGANIETTVSNTESSTKNNKMAEIQIVDCSNDKVLKQFYTSDDEATAIKLLDAVNNKEETDFTPDGSPDYKINFIDKGDSSHGFTYFFYIDGENLYVQFDADNYAYTEKLDMNDDILISTGITASQFLDDIINWLNISYENIEDYLAYT